MSVAVTLLSGVTALLAFAALRRIVLFFLGIRHMKLMTKNVPSPPGFPIIGNLSLLTDREKVYYKIMDVCHDFGPTTALWVGHVLLFIVTDPADMEFVLLSSKFNDKSFLYHSTKDIIGNGLVALHSEQHRRHRKAITPSLHLDILNEFVEIFDEESRRMVNTLFSLADKGTVFDVKPLIGFCANSAVCRTVLSTGLADDECNRTNFVNSIGKGQAAFMYRIWRPWLLNDWLYSWTSHSKEYYGIRDVVDCFVRSVLTKKIQNVSAGVEQAKKRRAFLDYMLSSNEGAVLSQEELVQEIKTIATVGSSSTMDAVSFMCYTMALRPDIQEKLQQEIDDIYGVNSDRPVTPSDLPHLQYTERFIKEVMRYFAVVPIFARHCPEDVKLPSGYTAPKGCQIAFFLPAVQMNPDHFPEPRKFDPDRFLPENSRTRHPFSFVPFSAGTRNCIGQRYAMMNLKTTLSNLVRWIRFLPAPDSPTKLEDVRLNLDLTLSVSPEAAIRVERRFSQIAVNDNSCVD